MLMLVKMKNKKKKKKKNICIVFDRGAISKRTALHTIFKFILHIILCIWVALWCVHCAPCINNNTKKYYYFPIQTSDIRTTIFNALIRKLNCFNCKTIKCSIRVGRRGDMHICVQNHTLFVHGVLCVARTRTHQWNGKKQKKKRM